MMSGLGNLLYTCVVTHYVVYILTQNYLSTLRNFAIKNKYSANSREDYKTACIWTMFSNHVISLCKATLIIMNSKLCAANYVQSLVNDYGEFPLSHSEQYCWGCDLENLMKIQFIIVKLLLIITKPD